MSEEQIKQYYERIKKLLNGSNKETYGFVPEEIRQILKWYEKLQQESQELKKQLEENQNPFRGIFAQVNDDTLLRDCGNMNAEINELKNQQKEFIDWLENEKDRLARECSQIYEDSLGKTRLVSEDIFNEVDKISIKFKEIIGGKDENNT